MKTVLLTIDSGVPIKVGAAGAASCLLVLRAYPLTQDSASNTQSVHVVLRVCLKDADEAVLEDVKFDLSLGSVVMMKFVELPHLPVSPRNQPTTLRERKPLRPNETLAFQLSETNGQTITAGRNDVHNLTFSVFLFEQEELDHCELAGGRINQDSLVWYREAINSGNYCQVKILDTSAVDAPMPGDSQPR